MHSTSPVHSGLGVMHRPPKKHHNMPAGTTACARQYSLAPSIFYLRPEMLADDFESCHEIADIRAQTAHCGLPAYTPRDIEKCPPSNPPAISGAQCMPGYEGNVMPDRLQSADSVRNFDISASGAPLCGKHGTPPHSHSTSGSESVLRHGLKYGE